MDDTAEHFSMAHCALGCGLSAWKRGLLVETLVRACCILVIGVFQKDFTQVGLVDDQEMVQTFFSGSTNPSLSKCIGIGRAVGCMDNV